MYLEIGVDKTPLMKAQQKLADANTFEELKQALLEFLKLQTMLNNSTKGN